MALFVGRDAVDRLLSDGHVRVGECIDAVEASFREQDAARSACCRDRS